ncbi:hypothetical protein C8R44DRAFT_863301 [Mycena epipterygia]|nr:hypothetical protein C8R44DRAFT_863301 [Mycena epipterygia]
MAASVACCRPDAKAFPLFFLLLPLRKLFMSKFAASVDVGIRWLPASGSIIRPRAFCRALAAILVPERFDIDGFECGQVEEKMGGSCISGPKASNVYTCKPRRVAAVLAHGSAVGEDYEDSDSTRSRRESTLIKDSQLHATQSQVQGFHLKKIQERTQKRRDSNYAAKTKTGPYLPACRNGVLPYGAEVWTQYPNSIPYTCFSATKSYRNVG